MAEGERYVHGYSNREAERLLDQAGSVKELLHHDTAYPPGSRVLEPGCGIGAQTVTLAQNSPKTEFVSVDISSTYLKQARMRVAEAGVTNVELLQADLFDLPFPDESFDHVFVCFLLEHMDAPVAALEALGRMLEPGGSMTVMEGDHGSCYFHPESREALQAWRCLIEVQAMLGGDSLIGRRLYPLLIETGFAEVSVSPRMVYADQSKPALMDRFVRKTIVPMVEGVEETALSEGLITEEEWQRGIADLLAIADNPQGTFCYTFFKATGIKRTGQ